MKDIGKYMVITGLLAIALNFINVVPLVLAWIYNWGETIAWMIKVGIIVLGAIFYLLGGKSSSEIE